MEQAAAQGVRLIVFPECCITGYWFIRNLSVEQLAALAEPIPDGPSTRRLIALARKHRHHDRRRTGRGGGRRRVFYNSYVVALPDGTVHRHRKLHAFEHPAIRSGTEFTVFDLPDGFRVGVLICYDCNLIENVRITALRGAEILIAPHQTGGRAQQESASDGRDRPPAVGRIGTPIPRRSNANFAATKAAAG